MAVRDERMQQLKADAAGWAADDIIPLEGELCVELDGVDSRLKVGDGSSLYSLLNFISRRTDAEFSSEFDTLLDAASTDASAGLADAGKVVLLDADGVIDSSMITGITGGSLTFLGETDFTASPPSLGGGYASGDVWVNDTAGQFDPGWLFGQDALSNERGCQVGDVIVFDPTLSGAPGWRFIGSTRAFVLIDEDHADDAAAATAGVPIGGLYHTSGAVKVRIA